MYQMLLWCTLCLVLYSAHAQMLGEGPCPNVASVADFDVDKFTGVWFEFERSPVRGETYVICLREEIREEGDKLVITERGFNTSTGQTFELIFTPSFVDQHQGAVWSLYSTVAHCTVGQLTLCMYHAADCGLLIFVMFAGEKNIFKVLLTDYTTYYMAMHCQDLPDIDQHMHHSYEMWILTRDKAGIDDVIRYGIYGHMIEQGLNPRDLSRVSQDCDEDFLPTTNVCIPAS